jgi:RecA-family ATPase
MAKNYEELYEQEVSNELFRLKVREAARQRFDEEQLEAQGIPEGVLAGDPIAATADELFPGLVPQHGATGIFGEKETGKSLVAVEIQHAALTGEPLWGFIPPKHTVAKTVHFLAEHHSYMLQQLTQSKLQFPATDNMRIFGPEHLGERRILISNGIRRNVAVETYKRCAEGAGLVVFDPIASFIQGDSNAENDNSSMRQLIMAMTEIASEHGAACLILGHKGKPTYTAEGRKIDKDKYAARGASAIEDSLAAVHYLYPLGKDGLLFDLAPVHYKGPKALPFKLHRNRENLRHTLLV